MSTSMSAYDHETLRMIREYSTRLPSGTRPSEEDFLRMISHPDQYARHEAWRMQSVINDGLNDSVLGITDKAIHMAINDPCSEITVFFLEHYVGGICDKERVRPYIDYLLASKNINILKRTIEVFDDIEIGDSLINSIKSMPNYSLLSKLVSHPRFTMSQEFYVWLMNKARQDKIKSGYGMISVLMNTVAESRQRTFVESPGLFFNVMGVKSKVASSTNRATLQKYLSRIDAIVPDDLVETFLNYDVPEIISLTLEKSNVQPLSETITHILGLPDMSMFDKPKMILVSKYAQLFNSDQESLLLSKCQNEEVIRRYFSISISKDLENKTATQKIRRTF